MQTIGILGGTFNPLHIGHLRPVIEVYEALTPSRIDLVPCASPPHKATQDLLPFDLRVDIIRAAIEPFHFLHVNTLEAERPGPSYTFDTLMAYREKNIRPFFILGAGDFITLPSWHRGLEIPQIGDIVVMPRSGSDIQIFHEITQEYWPGAVPMKPTQAPLSAGYRLPEGGQFLFLPQPRLDISSTLLRERWCEKRNISLLVPHSVLDMLEQHKSIVNQYWGKQESK